MVSAGLWSQLLAWTWSGQKGSSAGAARCWTEWSLRLNSGETGVGLYHSTQRETETLVRAAGPWSFTWRCGPARAGVGLRCHAPVLLVVPEARGGGAGQQEGGPPRVELRGHRCSFYCHRGRFHWAVGAGNERQRLAALPEVCWLVQLGRPEFKAAQRNLYLRFVVILPLFGLLLTEMP